MFKKILVPVDLAEPELAKPAIDTAIAMARTSQGSLRIVNVLPMTPVMLAEYVPPDFEVQQRKAAEDAIAIIAKETGLEPSRVSTTVRQGGIYQEILEEANNIHADLIVMSSEGRSGARKMFFGSTAERVLRQTVTPTLVVPPAANAIVRDDASGPSLAIAHVIAALDFSDTTAATAQAAATLAVRSRARLTLAHVVPPARGLDRWAALVDEHQAQRTARAGHELTLLAGELQAQVPDVRMTASQGDPERVLATLAAEQPQTLLVMGIRRGAGLLAPQPGSTAYKVLCLARTPVLVVPSRIR